jgi:ribonucleoside-diphosphate reductase alpha chain
MKKINAEKLWNDIAFAAWRCADPGVQYDTTINEWHTCPEGGPIRASNPCSEYMFLDNTACNLASFNLMKFFNPSTQQFDVEGYKHAIRLWTVILEVSVTMAQFPSREVAQLSYDYRTLGLGYANLGTLLMVQGIPYDSDKGRAIGGGSTWRAIELSGARKVMPHLSFIAAKVMDSTQGNKALDRLMRITRDFLCLAN